MAGKETRLSIEDRVWLKRNGLRDPDAVPATLAEEFLVVALSRALDIKENPAHRLHERYKGHDLQATFMSVADDYIWLIRGGHRWPELKPHLKSFEAALAAHRKRSIDIL